MVVEHVSPARAGRVAAGVTGPPSARERDDGSRAADDRLVDHPAVRSDHDATPLRHLP